MREVPKARNDIIYTLDHLDVGESVTVMEAARSVMNVIVRQMAREAQRLGIKVAHTGELTFTRLADDTPDDQCVRRSQSMDTRRITPFELAEAIKACDNKCEICRKEKKLVIDHNHVTGKVRGLLCMGCNTGMGKLGDSVEGLQRAIDYLQKQNRSFR